MSGAHSARTQSALISKFYLNYQLHCLCSPLSRIAYRIFLTELMFSPQNESDFRQWQSGSNKFFQSWIKSSSPPGIVQFLGTKQVVHDYERIRLALGYDKIHFLGMS